MKKLSAYLLSVCWCLVVIGASAFKNKASSDPLQGAWTQFENGLQHVLLFQDGYFTHTIYSKGERKFNGTHGGPYEISGNILQVKKEFDTNHKESIGTSKSFEYRVNGNELTVDLGNGKNKWQRLDEGKDKLAGTWKITGRKQDGNIVQIHQSGPRKTLKILSGTRFQWAAINPETKEFFGTGGGTYQFDNGTYTENIEFFSRDSSRVGASLNFEGKLVDGQWHHSGKSSRGDPIYEVWSRVKP